MSHAAIVDILIAAFPPRVVEGPIAPHDCPVCQEFRERLTGATWLDVPAEFIRDHADQLPLLAPGAYPAFLPAWLRQGVFEPDGFVAGMLLTHLGCDPDTTGFTVGQREAVIEVARSLVRNDVWGPEDPGNVEDIKDIECAWANAPA